MVHLFAQTQAPVAFQFFFGIFKAQLTGTDITLKALGLDITHVSAVTCQLLLQLADLLLLRNQLRFARRELVLDLRAHACHLRGLTLQPYRVDHSNRDIRRGHCLCQRYCYGKHSREPDGPHCISSTVAGQKVVPRLNWNSSSSSWLSVFKGFA